MRMNPATHLHSERRYEYIRARKEVTKVSPAVRLHFQPCHRAGGQIRSSKKRTNTDADFAVRTYIVAAGWLYRRIDGGVLAFREVG